MFDIEQVWTMQCHERIEFLKLWYHSLTFAPQSVFFYFSAWTLFLLSIPLDPSDSVLKLRRNMALQMFLGGAYITYWRPRYVSVHYMNLILRGYTLMLVDLVSHQLPFHFIFWQNDHPLLWTWWDRVWTNIPILLYWRFLGLWEYYRLENQDIFALFLLYLFFSFFL